MEGVSHARRLANILHFLCPPHFLPFLPLPCPLSLSRPRVTLQKAPSTKERTRPETLKPITIDQCALRREKMCLPARTRTNLSRYRKSCKVRDGVCSQLIGDTVQPGLKKRKIVSASFQVIFYSLQSLSGSTASAIPTYILVGIHLCVELFITPSMPINYKNVPTSPLLCK